MQPSIDSLSTYKHQIDSLSNLVKSNQGAVVLWNQAPVQAAIIVAGTTILTVILGFIFKDYWIPGWLQKRARRIAGQDLFASYKLNLTCASVNLLFRLREIYQIRAHYLWNDSPLQPFYQYKYKSSVYRLCTLLGWIRAYRILESSMIIKGTGKEFDKINKSINNIESALADGQRVEMYAAKALCSLIGVNIIELPDATIEKFSIELDHTIHEYLHSGDQKSINKLNEGDISRFVDQLQIVMDDLGIKGNKLEDHKEEVIGEVSIVLALIYRDWQHALGDLMLVRDNKDYNVISYKTFEDIWDNDESAEKKWLQRAEAMFVSLDLRVSPKTDSRIEQLKLVYAEVYKLVKVMQDIDVGKNAGNNEVFKKLSPTIDVPS